VSKKPKTRPDFYFKKLPKKSPFGNKCGKCGKPVRIGKHTMKCDGWHWHPACWKEFLS
jgi:hypothetical protein